MHRALPASKSIIAKVLVLSLCGLTALASFAMPAAATRVVATQATVSEKAGGTVFSLTLSKGVPAEIYTLSSPYRVIIDFPDVSFRLPKGAGREAKGLVSAFRFGAFAPGKSRIVLDATEPVRIGGADMANAAGGRVELRVRLEGTTAAKFGKGTGAKRAEEERVARKAAAKTAVRPRERRSKPVVVIDPGHGGIDPGTVSEGNVYEKDLVLSVAKRVSAKLKSRGLFDVKMTRTTDVFLSLDDRLAFSEKHEADLFVSLHADAIADQSMAQRIRGATVYTLSERASDEQARKMAEKENSSDLVAGLSGSSRPATGDVTNILIDLMRRETANFSTAFSNTLVSRLRKSVKVSRKPRRSAAFKVLKQTKTPSVLVELGYLSNRADEKTMQTTTWQSKVATSIADAVATYFAQRNAMAR